MNLLLTKALLIIILSGLIFPSCKKDVTPGAVIETPTIKKTWNETAKAVARDVSMKLKSLSFRKMLKHEVLLRFDGDANILLSTLIKRLPKYLAYEAAHNSTSRTNTEDLLSYYSFDILTEAAEDYPQMQIAVQTDAESWDPNAYTPSVVYLTADYDEETSTTIDGFDPYQTPISVSATEEPAINYVVISQNERTVLRNDDLYFTSSNCPIEPSVLDAPYNPAENPTALEFINDCTGGTGGGGTGGGGSSNSTHPQYIGTGHDGVLPTLVGSQMGTLVSPPNDGTFNKLSPVGVFNSTTVYRKNHKHEKMRQIRCDNIGKIEGWPAGAPEIRVHVFEQNILNPSENLQIFKEQFHPDKRKDINGKWWDAEGVGLHLWDYTGTGTKVSFGYYEYDPVLIPNEALVAIGQIIVDLLVLSSIDSTTTPNYMTIIGNIRQSVGTGIRSLKKKNGMSEYIGKDDYSIFNDEDQFNHNPGGTKFKTWPDL
jgi:hypothetical protein